MVERVRDVEVRVRPCSWGSSMLKPTDRPPPSCAPRFAASITPGPPPVTTAQPASAKLRPTARAASYGSLSSSTRAEPNSATAGRSISATFSKPARNSAAIFATDASMSDVPDGRGSCGRRSRDAVRGTCEAIMPERAARRPSPRRARTTISAFARPPPSRSQRADRQIAPPSKNPDRDQVDQVEEEAGVARARGTGRSRSSAPIR